MVSDVNKLAELVQLDSVPSWIRAEIELNRELIIEKLKTEGEYVLHSPDGKESVTLKPQAKMAAA